jgi:NADPH2:quinone reductase
MVRAIRIHEHGGPEAMRWENVEVPPPGPGQIRIRQTAIGLNFIDVYHRTGLYPLPSLPATLGLEGAGVVEAVGPDVSDLDPGVHVAYASPPIGAYAQVRLIPADRVVTLPNGIADDQAAAMMLKGMTARYLLHRTFAVRPGHTILVHAAAGGVGLILCQWARHLGATVIGTVGSDDKAALASAHGCHHPIVYTRESFTARVKALTEGAGVDVVYDSIGKSTFEGSLDCLKPLGFMVSFGNASGPVPAFEPAMLASRGSLFFTRPSLMHYTAARQDLLQTAQDLFAVVLSGTVRIPVRQCYPLAEAARAHRDLEARLTTGSTLLIP